MRGSIGKKWYAVVYDGVNPETGKYRRRWVPAGSRRGDAERLLADLVKRSHEGNTVVSDKVTLGDYLMQRWLPVQEPRLRRSTFDSYRRNIVRHVVPALGKVGLDKLTVEDLDLFYAQLLITGRRSRGGQTCGLSPKTVRNIHLMLNKALASTVNRPGIRGGSILCRKDGASWDDRRCIG